MSIATGRPLSDLLANPGELAVLERLAKDRVPDNIWLERIAFTLGRLGLVAERFFAGFAGGEYQPEVKDWLPWVDTEVDKAAPDGDNEIAAAWGDAYEKLKAETDG